MEHKLHRLSAQDERCQRLLSIPGVGILSATALVAAWLGLVPRQHSTGGKPTLMGISKRGDTYLRTLLIHGGRTVVRMAHQHQDRHHRWISDLVQRRGKNVSAVAVAHKNARLAWALLTHKTTYQASAV
jgi:transposase